MRPALVLRVAMSLPLMWGCAGNPVGDSGPAASCEVTDCFYERDVRDFEIVDRTTLVVYVGSQRCPFVLDLDGFNCDLTFTPEILFLQGAVGNIDRATSVSSDRVCASTRQLYVYTGIVEPAVLGPDSRIDPVTGRRTGPGGFGRPGLGGFGDSVSIDPTRGEVCRVRNIRSVNDDQLIELYVEEGVAPPPPPIGSGELEVPEEVLDQPSSDSTEPETTADRPAAQEPVGDDTGAATEPARPE